MTSHTLALILFVTLAPTWVAGYVWHMLGYRRGGRYDQVQSD